MSRKGANAAKKSSGFPELTARENWGKYFGGMAVEILYALVLAAVSLLIAYLMMAVYK